MGIPSEELTPRVEEALSLVMNELDKVRWELEISRQHEARLQTLADAHSYLPLLNRRALFAHIIRLSEHAVRTETEAVLIYIQLSNIDAIGRTHGLLIRDQVIAAAAKIVADSIREIDVAGEMGLGDFGVIQNLSDMAAAKVTGEEVAASLRGTPVRIDGIDVQLEVGLGFRGLDPALTPEEIVHDADISLRSGRVE